MKPIKVDKKTQKEFADYAMFKRSNDASMRTLMTTMERFNRQLAEASESVWNEAKDKYHLDPKKQYYYDTTEKEIHEIKTDKNSDALKQSEELVTRYENILSTIERMNKFLEKKK